MDDEQLEETIRRTIAGILAESQPLPSAPASCCPVTEIVIRVGDAKQVRTLSAADGGGHRVLEDICCHPLPGGGGCAYSLSEATVDLLYKAAAASGTTAEEIFKEKEKAIREELEKTVRDHE